MSRNDLITTVRYTVRHSGKGPEHRDAAINGLNALIEILGDKSKEDPWLGNSEADQALAGKVLKRAENMPLDVYEILQHLKTNEPPQILIIDGNESAKFTDAAALAKNIGAALWELEIHRRTGQHFMEGGVTDIPVAIVATPEGRSKLTVDNCRKALAGLEKQKTEALQQDPSVPVLVQR